MILFDDDRGNDDVVFERGVRLRFRRPSRPPFDRDPLVVSLLSPSFARREFRPITPTVVCEAIRQTRSRLSRPTRH